MREIRKVAYQASSSAAQQGSILLLTSMLGFGVGIVCPAAAAGPNPTTEQVNPLRRCGPVTSNPVCPAGDDVIASKILRDPQAKFLSQPDVAASIKSFGGTAPPPPPSPLPHRPALPASTALPSPTDSGLQDGGTAATQLLAACHGSMCVNFSPAQFLEVIYLIRLFAFQLSVIDAYSLADDALWADAPPQPPNTDPPTVAKPIHGVLTLNRVFNTDLELTGAVLSPSGARSASLWRAAIAVPIHDIYQLPLPKPALFGKTAFTLTLADSGIITKLEYSTTGGAGDAIGTATALVKAIQPATAESEVTEVQGKADLIYQQQRYTTYNASPSSCPSK